MIIRYSKHRPDVMFIFWDGSVDAWAAICKLPCEPSSVRVDHPGTVHTGDAIWNPRRGRWIGLDMSRKIRSYEEASVYGLTELQGPEATDYFYNVYLLGMERVERERVAPTSLVKGVKRHFKRSQKIYTAIGITAVVCGIAGYLAYKMKPVVVQTINGDIHAPVSATGDVIQNTNFGLERRVHPGWITQCVETGEKFASQNRAAEVFGGTASRMSEHLRGARDNFNGHHFIRVREFATP